MSSWEILFIGMALGAFAMRCAMLDRRLHWLKNDCKSNIQDWTYYDVTECSGGENDTHITASPRLLEDAPSATSESLSPVDEADQIENGQVVKDPCDKKSIETNSDVTSMDVPPNGDAIELQDLDTLEEYLYGDASPAPVQVSPAEPDELPQFPDAMWKVSFSVDAVMRPIQEIFAPELAYHAIDADLCTGKLQADAFRDNRELVKAMLRAIGRFAVRQDNLELLTKVWEYSASAVQEELWQFLEVVVEYGRLDCFTYLLPFVDGELPKARVLEFCAYHDQVEMMKQAFGKWTKFVKSDTANAPLVVAAAQGQMESVRFLLTKSTNVDISIKSSLIDKDYPTPVEAAAAGGHVAILQELIAAGAKLINWPDTIVNIAQRNDHLELMQFVLTEGPTDPELSRYKPQLSVLRSACEKGQLGIMHMLINYGADYDELLPCARKRGEKKSLVRTIRGRHELIVELLRLMHCRTECYMSISQSLVISRLAWMGDVEGLRMLFVEEPDVEVNVDDQSGNSPLFYAMLNHMKMRNEKLESTRQQWLRTIRLLLARGARLNLQDTSYWYTHHGGVPKEILSGLREMSKNAKSDRNPGTGILKG
jgi:ankyrin repeat protein